MSSEKSRKGRWKNEKGFIKEESEMKSNKMKKVFAAVTAGAMMLTLAAGSITASANPARGGFIGEAKAKQIALKHAGLKEKEVSFVRVALGMDDGRYEYDVEFYKGNVEYDYELDAKTGRILEVDKDIENFAVPGKKPSNPANPGLITLDQGKSIALKHAGLQASQVQFTKAKLDRDDGRQIYDIEFRAGYAEYDYEIDAKTGKILDFDYDMEDDWNDWDDDNDWDEDWDD